MVLIAVINESTLVNNTDAENMVAAIQLQVNRDFLPAWNMRAATVQFFASKAAVAKNDWCISILDNSTQAGALGYHTIEADDEIDGFIFAKPVLDNKGVVLYDAAEPQNTSVSSVLSHEVLEALGDPYANQYCDGFEVKATDGKIYSEYAVEVCDAVENNSYMVSVNNIDISVSNFVYPNYFRPEATAADAPFDQMRKLARPFSMTEGGYLVVRQSGAVQQIFAEKMPTWKQDMKKGGFSRPGKRDSKFFTVVKEAPTTK